MIKENKTVNQTNVGRMRAQMNATIHENIKDFDKTKREKKFKCKTILKTLRQLFCDVRNSKTEYYIVAL